LIFAIFASRLFTCAFSALFSAFRAATSAGALVAAGFLAAGAFLAATVFFAAAAFLAGAAFFLLREQRFLSLLLP